MGDKGCLPKLRYYRHGCCRSCLNGSRDGDSESWLMLKTLYGHDVLDNLKPRFKYYGSILYNLFKEGLLNLIYKI